MRWILVLLWGWSFSLAQVNPVPQVDEEITVLVVYHSPMGHTKNLAGAVADGARRIPGVGVSLVSVDKVKIADVIQAEAIILGCPVYNANVTPELQSFINSWPFESGQMRDKIGAAFTTGGGISAGEETVQLTILRSMLIFGMVVVGGGDWRAAFGASAITEEAPFGPMDGDALSDQVRPAFLQKGRDLGARVAGLAVQLKPKRVAKSPTKKENKPKSKKE